MHKETTDILHTRLPVPVGEFQLYHYSHLEDGKEHLALVFGDVKGQEDVLVRVHSECFTGDVLGSLRCDCGPQLQKAMETIVQADCGVVIYLRQEGRGIGLAQKLRAYNLQDLGYDTVDANLMLGHQADERSYGPAAAIITDLGITSIRLLTNNPEKIEGLTALDISVTARVPIETDVQPENSGYLQTKVERMRHMLNLTNGAGPNVSTADYRMSARAMVGAPAVDRQIERLRKRIEAHENPERPFVTVSYAQSLDGSIAANRNQPLPISGAASMKATHAIRACHDAILVGINTVLADDPQLNVRLVEGRSPVPVVLDSQLRIPPTARIFNVHEQVIVGTTATLHDNGSAASGTRTAQEALHRNNAVLTPVLADEDNRVSLTHLLRELKAQGIESIMVEGGSSVLISFLTTGLVDFLAVTIAPTFVGGLNVLDDVACSQTAELTSPSHASLLPKLDNPTWTPIGSDLIVWGEPCVKA